MDLEELKQRSAKPDMTQLDIQNRIRTLMAHFVAENKLAASTNNTDTNQVSEDALLPLFREIYGYHDLRNLNHSEKLNYPGIDLADDKARIAIQVTATPTAQKIKDTLTAFVSRKEYERYDRLIIFFLKEKPAISKKNREDLKKISGDLFDFDPSRDIQDSTDTLKAISQLAIRKQEEVLNLLEYQFGDDRKRIGNVQELLSLYRTRIIAMSSTFTVAGLQVALPIENAWIQLKVMNPNLLNASRSRQEFQAQFDYEWERPSAYSDRTRMNAEDVVKLHSRIIIVAGPGRGKSTLLRRITYQHSKNQNTVVWVRLPFIARSMKEAGNTFHEALVGAIVSKSGVSKPEAEYILTHSELLLADGLDECGGGRNSISQDLAAWGHSHPNCKVVVTTRPVGYDPGLFLGWDHFEIQPLGSSDTMVFVRQILEGYYGEQTDFIENESKRFEKHRKKNAIASLASSNPLLLGFLINLSINRKEISNRRSLLYKQILNLIRDSSPNDRDLNESIEEVVAFRFLEAFGWLLQESPTMAERELVDAAGKLLMNELKTGLLNAKSQAQQSIRYWEERQLLERTATESGDIVSFIHPTLAEYCAGQYISSWNEIDLRQWIVKMRLNPKWHETIILAVGTGSGEQIILHLIDLDDPEDPLSIEALLATKVFKEMPIASDELLKLIVDRLIARLTSSTPSIAFEALESCLTLMPNASIILESHINMLVTHPQPWTRIIGWRISFECGDKNIDIDLLKDQFVDLWSIASDRSLEWTKKYRDDIEDYLPIMISLILRDGASEETIDYIGDILLDPHITMGLLGKIEDVLIENNCTPPLKRHYDKYPPVNLSMEWLEWTNAANKHIKEKSVTALLDAILLATSDSNQGDIDKTLPELSTLISGIGLNNRSYILSYLPLSIETEKESLASIIQAAIVLLGITPKNIRAEAEFVRDLSNDEYEDNWTDLLTESNAKFDWTKLGDIKLSGGDLARALDHPSDLVANIAAEIIIAGHRPSDLSNEIEKRLSIGGPNLFKYASGLATDLWDGRAEEVLLQRLEGELTDGIQYLFRCLRKVTNRKMTKRLETCFKRGLFASDISIATGAAEGILSFTVPQEMCPTLEKAWNHWQIQEEVYPDFLPPESTPRSFLLQTMWKLKKFDIDELIAFYRDKHYAVRQAVISVSIEAIQNSPELRASFFQRIFDGRAPLEILEKFSSLSIDTLKDCQSDLVMLLDSPLPSVRRIITQSLGSGWIDKVQSLQLCEARLNDEDPSVRSQAATTLRTLSQ